MGKKLPKVTGYCVVTVMPLTERKLRACGKPADKIVGGRPMCRRHSNVLLKREKNNAERHD